LLENLFSILGIALKGLADEAENIRTTTDKSDANLLNLLVVVYIYGFI